MIADMIASNASLLISVGAMASLLLVVIGVGEDA